MKLGVVGSRNFNDYWFLESNLTILKKIYNFDTIVSGGAKGADQLAEKFANIKGLALDLFLPDWNQYGKSAAFIRNQYIIDYSDILVAFWDGKSRGTLDSINKAEKKGIPIYIIRFDI